MEQHPIPQNVTNFQFKLIGDITLKQFGYVAGGLILAYLATKVSLIPTLLRYPIAGVCALLGVGLAFVPIEERPLDRWLISFFKSIYTPTQFVWKKNNLPPEVLMSSPPQLEATASSSHPQAPVLKPPPPMRMIPTVPLMQPAPQVQPRQAVTPPPPPLKPPVPPPQKRDWWAAGAPPVHTNTAPLPSTKSSVTGKKVVFEEKKPAASTPGAQPQEVEKIKHEFQKKNQTLTEQIASLQKELTQGVVAKDRLLELQQLLTQLLTEKDRMGNELTTLKRQLSQKDLGATEKPTQYTTYQNDSQTTVKMVSPQGAIRAGIPTLTQIPNVITGIIKDSSGTLLTNLIVTVKDKDGIPVRALKSNRLGQFAASTPLTNSTYVIEVEDPKKSLQFHRIEVSLTGQVLPPLEISAVSPKDLMRAKLTQEIFGKNTI